MKNFLSVLSSTLQGGLRGGLLILALLATTSLWAYDFQSGDLYYNITSDSTVAVTYQEYNSSSNYASIYTVTVPETITYDGTTYSVTSIGKYAFYDCSSIVSVTIPNSVTHIGDHAFYKTSSLTSVNIPNSVTSIGDYAFRGCSSLTAIDIPNSLTKIVHGMFDDCSSLATVTIPNSVTSIDTWAFSSCTSLTSITIPNSVTRIGSFAFEYCRSLTAITIPESVTDIGSGAFESCSSLTSVVWNAIKCRQAYNYDGYTHFEIELMDSTNYSYEEIGEFVKYFHLDEGNIINNSPFHGCDGIKSFSFGENVEFIPEGLCYGLDGIISITIPESVSSIGERSFGECSSLDTIYCYSKNLPIMYLTDLHVHIVNIEMVYTYDEATPYIYDNTILYVPCQLLDAYKSQEEYTIRFPNIQCLEDLTPSEPQDTTIYSPTEGIGVFSVGEGKTVTFSRGNLQYTQSTDTWSFAENQYDYIGTDNVTGGSVSSDPTYGDSKEGTALADKIDLFGWSTSATNFGASTSTDYDDYYGSFVDWGTNQIGTDAPNTWRTLSYNEWSYLRNTRVNADALCGVAQVNGVNGLIFLPDTWTCPKGVTFKSGFHNNDDVDYYAAYQTFTIKEWSKLEAAGAIFLPASGYRGGSYVGNVQGYGYYWSATEGVSNYAGFLCFFSGGAGIIDYNRASGRSVRLVKDVNNTTPEPPTQPQDTTIYLPILYKTICEGTTFVWMGMEFTAAGMFISEEIVEEENYIYHYIHTLDLTVIPSETVLLVEEAYDSYEWHGEVYTESGVYTYEEWCYQEILELTIIPSQNKEYVYEHHNYLVCDAYIFVDPITGSTHVISSLIPFSLTWSDTIIGTNIDTIHTFNITPIVSPEPLTEDMLYAIGAVPKLVAGEKVDLMGTTELIMAYYQMIDQHDIADVIGVEWVAGHDVVLDTEQTTHTMVLEVWDECDYRIPKEFTFPVSKKDSEPQDTTIYISYEDVTICEGITFVWMGMEFTEEGIYTSEEIVVEDDYIYHYIYTLHLTVLPPTLDMYEVTAYDSYEWHGVVYTESGVYTYRDPYNTCVIEELHLTIIDTPTIPTEYVTICEGETYIWMGMPYTEAGTYTYEIVEDEDYIYHYTLELTVLPYERVEYEMIAYDSYVWHDIVYTESGTYTYQYECTTEVLYLTIIPSEDNQGEVVVEPSTNSVTITWQKEDDADTYIIVIKQSDKVVCTLIFDAEGNLVSVNYLPGRESNQHGIQHAGLTSDSFQYTITGLTPSTDYTYTVTATDDSDNTISSYSGEFTTHHATSVENTNSQSPTIDCQKILYEDHIYILRDGKTYTIMGQEI